MRKTQWFLCLALGLALAAPGPAAAGSFARVEYGATQAQWVIVEGTFESLTLTVSKPERQVFRQSVAAGKELVFDLRASSEGLDGDYAWELRAVPVLDATIKKMLAEARRTGDDAAIERLKREGKMPREEDLVQSGTFTVADGVIVPLREDEDGKVGLRQQSGQPSETRQRTAGGSTGGPRNLTAADQVIPDDLIVQGSFCVGFDCVNNESFGFDTIRLKENNTRIKFEDTSVGTFPTNDWQLTANDSASGGQSKFSIEDVTGARIPFTVEAGATTNSVYVDSTGRVGFRTATPVLDLHVNTSNTPALRLEQNSSGGFTAQTWDVAGNEANFFVRDVTGGSRLPFRIRPGAPTSSIDINASGDVGIGTASPNQKLHVLGSDGTTEILVEETNGTPTTRTLLELTNNGASRLNFTDSSVSASWGLNNVGGNFNMIKSGAGVTAFALQGNGTLTVINLIESSDRDAKTDIVAVRPEDVLAKVSRLPIATWRFKQDASALHMGPMAQDFAAIFGLGQDDRHIKALDVAGVSLAAVQALHQQVNQKDSEIAALKQRLTELEALVASLAVTLQK